MAKSKNRWDVIYETVDEKNKKLIPHFATQNVDWKTALMVKRNNKFIAMEIRPTLCAADECQAGGLHNFVDCIIPDTVEECSKCGIRR